MSTPTSSDVDIGGFRLSEAKWPLIRFLYHGAPDRAASALEQGPSVRYMNR